MGAVGPPWSVVCHRAGRGSRRLGGDGSALDDNYCSAVVTVDDEEVTVEIGFELGRLVACGGE